MCLFAQVQVVQNKPKRRRTTDQLRLLLLYSSTDDRPERWLADDTRPVSSVQFSHRPGNHRVNQCERANYTAGCVKRRKRKKKRRFSATPMRNLAAASGQRSDNHATTLRTTFFYLIWYDLISWWSIDDWQLHCLISQIILTKGAVFVVVEHCFTNCSYQWMLL